MDRDDMLRSLDVIQAQIDRLRAELTADPPRSAPVGPTGKPADVFDVLRGLCFLGAFYVAPDQRLLPAAVSEAAARAGYDPRGTGGYYTGNGSLSSEGDYRVLTPVGLDWFVKTYPDYKRQLLERFPQAPDIDL